MLVTMDTMIVISSSMLATKKWLARQVLANDKGANFLPLTVARKIVGEDKLRNATQYVYDVEGVTMRCVSVKAVCPHVTPEAQTILTR